LADNNFKLDQGAFTQVTESKETIEKGISKAPNSETRSLARDYSWPHVLSRAVTLHRF